MRKLFALILFWLLFVVSLTGWWLYFGLHILERVIVNQPDLARHQRMLFMEGCVLIFFLFCGGLALFYFSYRMYKEKKAKEIFFASFTHDLKTALFRIQLEVEKLGYENQDVETEKILAQTRKMQMDLENALDSSVGDNKIIFLERLSLKNIMEELHAQWPELRIRFKGDDALYADRKALQSVFKNLLHNSYLHGEADDVSILLENTKKRSHITYSDNGKEFKGSLEDLGKIYPNSNGGSGFGIYIIRQWVLRLGGRIDFLKSPNQSLKVTLEIPWRPQ